MKRPLQVEIIAYAPTAFYHCLHCELVWQQAGVGQALHAEQLASGLPEDLQRAYQDLAAWIARLLATYCDRIAVKVIDAVSVEGWWKSLRYGARRYPAVIVDGQVFTGGDFAAAEAAIAQRLGVPQATA
ncbi:hypothetical protein HRbin22_00272 [Candidatus Thermoflexus japonica]|uniref:Glutaredoxin n=1 Tax=Candidatus Thermoflexus japonica TaxID=2035417 RepID=A0A2H5Y3L8_9CHLR|nr:hypothetical protein HRbin22_00272 [Candidatus Thermoflexus japonica]